jgi:hypothetical protein
MSDELQRIWIEAFMAHFKLLFWHLSGVTKDNYGKPVRIAIPWAEFRVWDISNMKQEC